MSELNQVMPLTRVLKIQMEIYIVILSAHCIPATKDWLLNFVKKSKKKCSRCIWKTNTA